MALTAKSLFLYGFNVTEYNRSLDFKTSAGGAQKQATLTLGYYSLSALATEVVKQLQAADPAHKYQVTVNRTVNFGTENRVTISTTDGSYLSLLFGSGTRAVTSCATLLGFTNTDKTGALSYTGTASAGISLVTNWLGSNYTPPELMRKNFGSVNVSSSGAKEAIVWAVQKFWQVQFKYIPEDEAIYDWSALMTWLMLQRSVEFTPEITNPTLFYEGTIESTEADGKGLGFTLKEMLPMPGYYDTGLLKFRVKE